MQSVSSVESFICGTDQWGPFQDGVIAPCFQDTVTYPTLLFAMILLGAYRLVEIHRLSPTTLSLGQLFFTKLSLCFVIPSISVVTLFVQLYLDTFQPYEILYAATYTISWILAAVVLVFEGMKGYHCSWVLRVWWTLAFIAGSLKLQAMIALLEGSSRWMVYAYAPEYALVVCITTIGLWFNGQQDVKLVKRGTRSSLGVHGDEDGVGEEQEGLLGDARHDEADLFDDELLSDASGRASNPEASANIFSKITFWWFNALLYAGYDHALTEDDLFELHDADMGKTIAAQFNGVWKGECAKKKPRLSWALIRTFGGSFAFAGLFKLVQDAMVFAGPVLLSAIINYVQSDDDPLWHGLGFAVLMLCTSLLQTVCVHQYFHRVYRVGMRIRASVVMVVYQKAFRMSSAARKDSTVGQIVNHMSLDAQRLMDLMPYLHMVWSAPLQIVVCIALLARVLGWAVVAGVAIMVILIPLNALLAKKLASFQKAMMVFKDERIRWMNEILQGIRLIKLFAWEGSFSKIISDIRTNELSTLAKGSYLRVVVMFFWTATPVLVSVASFGMYTALGHSLTAEVAFTAVALFNVLRFPLNMLPNVIAGLVEAYISTNRLSGYLLGHELTNYVERDGVDPSVAVSIDGGSFAYDVMIGNTLEGVDLAIEPGELVAVVGSVGAGKSALLAAILGDINMVEGRVRVRGDVAYVAQQAWIRNATLRDNILNGQPYDEDRYADTVRVCELEADLAMLPAGDQTEIGEKGINLSGGQKQRVNLARAVYSNHDVVLLDDPLAAVDAHVGKMLFDRCLVQALRGKTRVLVTHQLQHLSGADKIVVLKDGRIAENGTYAELLEAGGEFAELIREHVHEGKRSSSSEGLHEDNDELHRGDGDDDDGDGVAPSKSTRASLSMVTPRVVPKDDAGDDDDDDGDASSNKPDNGKKKASAGASLMSTEHRDVGSVSWRVYWNYVTAIGGAGVGVAILLFFGLAQGSKMGSDYWLAAWTQGSPKMSTYGYLGVYVSIGMANAFFTLFRTGFVMFASLNSAKTLHQRLLQRVFRAPMSFFDTTPIGRVLNRFSKDIYTVDETLPRVMIMFLSCCFSAAGAVIVISTVTPFFLAVCLPLAWVYYYVQQYYIRSSREVKRLDSISKSPIYAHFSETLSGVSTIRAYHQQDRFVQENCEKLDTNQRAYYASIVANRWLGVRLEFVGTCIVFAAALFVVLERDNIDPGLAGLSLSYALTITGMLNWLVRMSTELETQLVAVERVVQYTKLESEAPLRAPPTSTPPDTWPSSGEIQLFNYKLRYREGLDLVLKGLTCHIKPAEKIGVVGRTGAGKSSLMLALFRLVEAAEGRILIDGVDIASIGLHDLRSKLAIIPQDPTLFTGTIRSNLDPFEDRTDEEVWAALERTHLAERVRSKPEGLDAPVAEFGDNFSVGERQLLCLGRALLREAKVMVLDEATAAVDFETDALIQRTIREAFADRTVLTIAHRVHTIMDSDRVLVLDQGRLMELAPPSELLADEHSMFYALVAESGTTKQEEEMDE